MFFLNILGEEVTVVPSAARGPSDRHHTASRHRLADLGTDHPIRLALVNF